MQKIFSIETYLGPLLMRYMSKYVKLRDDQFQLSLWGGDAVLNYVELQYDIFEDLMPVPIGFKSGHIHELRIQVPWTRLGSSSIVITLNTVECILAFKRPGESRRCQSETPSTDPLAYSDSPPPSYLQSYLTRIWSNIEVVVNNLIVKFVEGDAVISLNIHSLDCFPTLPDWQRGIESPSPGNYCLHRLLKLSDITLCIDKCDANGRISAYQDPVIYRYSIDIRLQTIFTQNNNGLASICVSNLYNPEFVEINLSQVQIPLVARLLEILAALSNNILRWEALSDNHVLGKKQEIVSKRTEAVENGVDAYPSRIQSWSQWAWSFVPLIPSFSSNPSDENMHGYDLKDSDLEFLDLLEPSEARAEYLKLLYEDSLAPSNETAKVGLCRRNQLLRLRKYQKPVPALVLGVLMTKIQINIKTLQSSHRSGSNLNQSSYSKKLRRNESTLDILTVTIENLGFQCVQDVGYFASVHCGVGLLKISPTCEVCPCGKRSSSSTLCLDLLNIRPKITRMDDEDVDALLKAFCGLFRYEEWNSSCTTEKLEADAGQEIVVSQPAWANYFILPPFCRKDYLSTYGSDYPQSKLSLGMWFESLSSREAHDEGVDECSANQHDVQYSFNRFVLDTVKINFTPTLSHRMQHFLRILADGSKEYKPCADWTSIDVLPPQEPVDGWILQERMARLRQFTPLSIKRGQVLSLCIEIFPPSHDHLIDHCTSLKIETDCIETLISSPLDRVQLVFTMTHLYPSPGIISDVNASFCKDLLKNPLECKSWGKKEQISACFGVYRQSRDDDEYDVKTRGVLFDFEEKNPITRPLQIDLLNGCYARQLVCISGLRITSGEQTGSLLSPLSITMTQRKLLFAESWPQHLVDGLAIRERSLKLHSQICLNLNSITVRNLSAYGFFLTSDGRAIFSLLSRYLHNGGCTEDEGFPGQLNEAGFRSFFKLPINEKSYCLRFKAKGSISFYSQSGKTKSISSLTLETPSFSANLVDPTKDAIIPIFERSCGNSGTMFSFQVEKTKISGLDDILGRRILLNVIQTFLGPSLVVLKLESLNFVLTSTLIEWFNEVTSTLKSSWEEFNEVTPDEIYMGVKDSMSFQKLGLHKKTFDYAKLFGQSIFTSNKLDGPFDVIVTESEKVLEPGTPLKQAFSEWIVATYKWFASCKFEIIINGPTIYLCQLTEHFSSTDCTTWFASLSSANRAGVVQISLPRIDITVPSSHCPPPSRGQPAPPSAPSSLTEFPGIRLYSFELEEKRAEEVQRRLRRMQSNPELEMLETAGYNQSILDCKASGAYIFVEMSPLPLFKIERIKSSLTITISSPKPGADSLDWNLRIEVSPETKSNSEASSSLKDVVQLLKIVSGFYSEVELLKGKIYSTKSLIASRIQRAIHNTSHVSTPYGNEIFSPSKRFSSLISNVTYTSSLHSPSGSRRTPLRPSFSELSVGNSQISVHGRVQITLPSWTYLLYLNDNTSAIRWEIEGFSSTVSIHHPTSFLHFRVQLRSTCLVLHSREKHYPLLSPRHWHLRPFQNVTPCPGTELGQSRPKPRSPQNIDGDNDIDVAPSRHYKPTPVLKLSVFRCSAGLVRQTFAGKRFTHWLDRESEWFLQGDNSLEGFGATPPFVNCIYIRLKPVDVVLCPQLVSHVKSAFGGCVDAITSIQENKTSSSGAKAPLPGHCLPLIFIAVDELRCFVPSSGLLNPLSEESALADTITLTIDTMRLHPFPTYSITSRPPEAESNIIKQINLKTTIGSPLEDRQYILLLDGLACWAVKLVDVLNYSDNAHRFDYQPTLAGQYPAFEWNQAATRLSDMKDAVWVLPMLKPLDVTAIYAAPVCDNSLIYGQARLLLGSSLEVNISHDIIVTLCTSFLANYLSNFGGLFTSTSTIQPTLTRQTPKRSCHASRILFTCGFMRFVAWERRISTDNCWDFSVVEIIHSHLTWSPDILNAGLNDLRIYLRTFCDGTGSKTQESVFWTPTAPQSVVLQSIVPSCLPLPQLIELDQLCTSDGVCFSTSGVDDLFLINFSRQNANNGLFEVNALIQRNITFVLTPAMFTIFASLSKAFQSTNSLTDPPEVVDGFNAPVWIAKVLSKVYVNTRSISTCLITAEDKIGFSIERIHLEGSTTQNKDWRSLDTTLKMSKIIASLNEFQCIPSGTELSLRLSIEISSVNTPVITADLEISRGTRVILPLGKELKRLTEKLACFETHNSAVGKKFASECLPERQVFVDDLRQKSSYDSSIFVPIGPSGLGDTSKGLPLPFKIVFAECDQFAPEGIAEERCVTMTWTFPEPRQIVRLTVNPVPLVYENDYGKADDIKLPARLQYWNKFVGEYGAFVTYANFELQEDASVDVQLPPEIPHDPKTLEQFHRHQIIYRPSRSEKENTFWGSKADIDLTTSTLPVTATTWRIIISCSGRCTLEVNSAESFPVFLSPCALAACTRIESVYIPELSRIFTVQLLLEDFCISSWKVTKQSSSETGRVNISKLHCLLANSRQPNRVPQWSFSLDSAAVHIFSPHAMHLQPLCQVKGVLGISGTSLSVTSCYLCCSSTLVYSLRHLLKGDSADGWIIQNRTNKQLCVNQWFSGIQSNEPSAEALGEVTRFCLDAGECQPSWRPIVMPTADSRNQIVSLRFKRSTIWSVPVSLIWPPVHNNRTLVRQIRWISSTEMEGISYPLFLLIPPRSSSGTPGEIAIQPGLMVENNLPIAISITLPNGSTIFIGPSSSQGLCVPSGFFDVALSARSTNRATRIEWNDFKASKEKIILLPIGEDVSPVLLAVNHSLSYDGSLPISSVTLAPALNMTSTLPMLLTLEVATTSDAHFLTSAEGNFSKHVNIPKGLKTPIMVAFQLGSQPMFNFLYPNRSQVFESPLSVPLEKAFKRIEVFVKPWLLITNRSGISLQVFTAESLEGINHPCDSIKLDTGSSFIPAAGERLLRVGLRHKESVVWSPSLLVHNSVFSSSSDSSTNPINDQTVTILTASGTPRTGVRKIIGQTPADAVLCLTRAHPLIPISLLLGGVVCALAVHLDMSECSQRGVEVAALSIIPLLHLINRSNRTLICKPIVAPIVDVQQPLPTADVDELDAEVVSLPPSENEKTAPLLFWNFTHPNFVFKGVDSQGILLAHLLVLRSHLGIFWSRSLHLTEILSTDGVRNFEAKKHLRRYYHVSLPGFDENGDPNECSLLLTLSNESLSGTWTLFLENLTTSLSTSFGCSLVNITDFSFEASTDFSEFHKLPVSNALPRVYPNGGRLMLILQSSLDRLVGMPASGKVPKSDFFSLEHIFLHLYLNFNEVTFKLTECDEKPLSLIFASRVVFIQRTINPHIPYSIEFILFSDEKPPSHLNLPLSRPVFMSVFIDTILVVFPIAGSLLKQGDPGLRDFIRVSIRCIDAFYSRNVSLSVSDFNITSSLIQVDNLAQTSLSTFDFPVLLRSVLSHTVEVNSNGSFSCSGKIRYLSDTILLDKFDLRLPSVEVYLEEPILYALFSWFEDLKNAWSRQVESEPTSNQFPTVLCLRDFHIHSVALQLSLKAKVGVHISCKTTQFHLNSFIRSNTTLQLSALLAQLSTHYISQILIRSGLVLGSLELIGNPVSLVASFAEGVSDLIHFAGRKKMASKEQLGPLRGLARGLMSLVKHATGGVCNSITGLASSVAQNLHELSLDTEHIQRTTEARQSHRLRGLGDSLALGLSEFGISLLGGLAGVAHHPLFALLDSSASLLSPASAMPENLSSSSLVNTAEAFVGGIGRGIAGLVAKPLAGVADLVAFTGAGFMHEMGADWGITPSPSHINCPILLPDTVQLVDTSLLHRWSCALMRHLGLPQFREYLWNGLGTDTTHTDLTWLCLPYPGALLAIEFKASVQAVRVGVIPINFINANDEDILAEDVSNSEITPLLTRCRLSLGDMAVLRRVLQCSGTEDMVCEIDGSSTVIEAGPKLERNRTCLMSLSRLGDGERNTGCA